MQGNQNRPPTRLRAGVQQRPNLGMVRHENLALASRPLLAGEVEIARNGGVLTDRGNEALRVMSPVAVITRRE